MQIMQLIAAREPNDRLQATVQYVHEVFLLLLLAGVLQLQRYNNGERCMHPHAAGSHMTLCSQQSPPTALFATLALEDVRQLRWD
jgi:hypothetical protein